MKIDVAVMTRNAGRFLDNCIKSVFEGVDVNRLIVVDGGSEDDSLEIADRYGCKVFYDGGRGLGVARQIAIEAIETPWFAFVDSDVELGEGWQEKITRYTKPMRWMCYRVGAVESTTVNIAQNLREADVTRIHNSVMRKRYSDVSFLNGGHARGFTGATLIRAEAVRDIKIPPVPCCEDWAITQHVLSKGYKWVKAPLWVRHHDRFIERPERIRQTHAVARVLGYMSLPRLVGKSVTALVGRLAISAVHREPRYFLHRVGYTADSFEGYLNPSRYLGLKYPGWEYADS